MIDNYNKYFTKKYRVNSNMFDTALATIRRSTNQKLYRYLDATLNSAKSLVEA